MNFKDGYYSSIITIIATLLQFFFHAARRSLSLQYMNSWQRFNETSLPDKKEFYFTLKEDTLQMLIINTQKSIERF